MNKTLRMTFLLALAPLAAIGLAATTLGRRTGQETRAPSVSPARSSPVRGLVLARPFAVEESYEHAWRLERPQVRAGWLLVLEVDPRFVKPRQMEMPVLLLGDQTVECVNFGFDSGRVIAIVPAEMGEDGAPILDFAPSPAWFGAPELPERVGAAWIAAERARTRPEDALTFTAAELAAARERGGAVLQAASRDELDRTTARLVLEYSPADRELAEGMLAPAVK